MKPERVIAILKTFTMEELVNFMNHWMDHWRTDYRMTIVKKNDIKGINGILQQCIVDGGDTSYFKTHVAVPNEYLFYDYEGYKNIVGFETPEDIFEYFAIEDFVTLFEYMSYKEIFGWMNDEDVEDDEKDEEKLVEPKDDTVAELVRFLNSKSIVGIDITIKTK